jgi:hypothetical protein
MLPQLTTKEPLGPKLSPPDNEDKDLETNSSIHSITGKRQNFLIVKKLSKDLRKTRNDY